MKRRLENRVKCHHMLSALSAKKAIFLLLRYAILILLAYQLLYPILYMVSMAIRAPQDAYDPSIIWIPKNLSKVSFVDAFKSMNYFSAFKTSMCLAVGCAIFDTISCALAGYGFARFDFPFKNVFFVCVIFTLIVPTQTIILPFYMNMKYFDMAGLLKVFSKLFGTPESINLVGSYWSFYLPSLFGAGIRSGLYIYIFRQFFEGMPQALEEAAYVDGSGALHTFLYVMLPNAKNAIISVALFSFVWHFNDYYLSRQLLGTSQRTITVALSSLRVNLQEYVGATANIDPILLSTRVQAGCLLAILPLFVLYLFTQSYFTDSIEHIGNK